MKPTPSSGSGNSPVSSFQSDSEVKPTGVTGSGLTASKHSSDTRWNKPAPVPNSIKRGLQEREIQDFSTKSSTYSQLKARYLGRPTQAEAYKYAELISRQASYQSQQGGGFPLSLEFTGNGFIVSHPSQTPIAEEMVRQGLACFTPSSNDGRLAIEYLRPVNMKKQLQAVERALKEREQQPLEQNLLERMVSESTIHRGNMLARRKALFSLPRAQKIQARRTSKVLAKLPLFSRLAVLMKASPNQKQMTQIRETLYTEVGALSPLASGKKKISIKPDEPGANFCTLLQEVGLARVNKTKQGIIEVRLIHPYDVTRQLEMLLRLKEHIPANLLEVGRFSWEEALNTMDKELSEKLINSGVVYPCKQGYRLGTVDEASLSVLKNVIPAL